MNLPPDSVIEERLINEFPNTRLRAIAPRSLGRAPKTIAPVDEHYCFVAADSPPFPGSNEEASRPGSRYELRKLYYQSFISSYTISQVSRDTVNLLLALICILSLVLSGGFIETLIPGAGAEFSVNNTRECPPAGPFRCKSMNGSEEEESSAGSNGEIATPTGTSTSDTPTTSPTAADTNTPTAGQESTDGTPTIDMVATTSQRAAVEITPPLEWFLLPFLLGLAVLLAVGSVFARRRGYVESPRDVRRLTALSVDWLLMLLVRLAILAANRIRRLRTTLSRTASFIWMTIEMPFRTVTGPDGFYALASRLAAGFQRMVDTFAALLSLLGLHVRGRQPSEYSGRDGSGHVGSTTAATGSDPEANDRDFDIGTAWSWLAAQTKPPHPGPRTPDEIARDAISKGYPADAVRDLLRVFRDVTYGGHPPTAKRRQTARRAYERLQTTARSTAQDAREDER